MNEENQFDKCVECGHQRMKHVHSQCTTQTEKGIQCPCRMFVKNTLGSTMTREQFDDIFFSDKKLLERIKQLELQVGELSYENKHLKEDMTEYQYSVSTMTDRYKKYEQAWTDNKLALETRDARIAELEAQNLTLAKELALSQAAFVQVRRDNNDLRAEATAYVGRVYYLEAELKDLREAQLDVYERNNSRA